MQQASRLWTKPFIAIVLMAFLFFVSIQLMTAGFPAYITEIKANPTQGGLMTTAFMVAAIITRPFVSYYMRKVNLKWMSILSLLFIIITVSLSLGQKSVAYLLLLRVLHGIGFGVITTIFATLATNIIPKKRIGEGVGYYSLATSIGTSFAPMLALAFLEFWDFNTLLIITVILAGITLVFSFSIKSPKKVTVSAPAVQKGTFKEYAFDKKALLPCLLTAFFALTLGGVISFLRELGKEAELEGTVSLFFLVMAIVMLIVRPVSGRVYDSMGHKVIIYPAAISGIIGLIFLSIAENAFMLLMAGAFYGIAYGTVTPTLQSIAVSYVTREKQGTANAMFFSSMDLGMAVGSTGLGILASATSFHIMYGLSALCLVGLLIIYTFVFVRGENIRSVLIEHRSNAQEEFSGV
jgi:MFS family permease